MPIILSETRLKQAIDNPEFDCNKGKFMAFDENKKCVAVDNRSGNAWTEKFDHVRDALDWLNDKYQTHKV